MTRVSVITPCYEAAAVIEATLDGVAAQTLRDWEHVVVDDGSPDATADLVTARLGREPRLRLIRQANAGVSAARNRGFAASDPNSDYVLFLDADDVLEPQMLETMVRYLDSHPDVAMAFCEPTWIDAEDRPVEYGSPGTRYVPGRVGVHRLPVTEPVTPFAALFFWGRINVSISLLRRSAYERTGGFSVEQGLYGEDLDMWLKLALRGTIHYLPQRLVRRRIHALSHGRMLDSHEQDTRLYGRWLNAGWLTDEEQRMVHRLWLQRQSRLLPRLWREWGWEHLRKGEVAHAAACYLRSGKRVATYLDARLHRRLPAGPAW